MTTLIVELRTPDGARNFEVLASFEDRVVLAETCVEILGAQREWRDTRSILLLVGRKPRATGGGR
jgi:hypothetical protein